MPRNIGIEMARGKYIFMLDDDSYPLPQATEAGIRILETDKSIGCVAYRIQMPGKRYWSNGVHTVFTGCGALFPANILKNIGGYPEDFLFYAEEYDVAFRLWRQGYSVFNAKELIVFHEKSFGNEGFEKRLNHLVRNNAAVYSKYLPKEWAINRIEYENWRYKAIAKKENASDGYLLGLKRAVDAVYCNMQSDRLRLSEKAAYMALGLAGFEKRLNTFLKDYAVKKAAILTAGKLLPEIIMILRSKGIDIRAVVEDNKIMISDSIEGIDVLGYDKLKTLGCDCLISGSSSLTVNDSIEETLKGMPSDIKDLPFLRMCEYDIIE